MNVTIEPKTIRSYVPITVNIDDTLSPPVVKVSSLSDGDQFEITATPITKNLFQTQFWLEKEGHYKVSVLSNSYQWQKQITVHEQLFLPFSVEFGSFFILLMITLYGVFVWHKKKTKAQTLSN